MQEWLYPMGVVLLGYTVLGLTGFGSALVIVPLLAWQWPLPQVVALTLLMDVPASAFHSGLNWRQVQWRELGRLVPGLVLGTLLGLWLMPHLQARWPLLLLGLYVAAVGVNALRPAAKRTRLPAPRWAYPVGTAIGLVEMLFGTAGPLVVAWLSRRVADVQQMRASTPMIITVAASTVLVGMGWEGRLSSDVLWQRWLVLMGVALCGVWLGHRVAHRVPVARLRQIICGLLVVSGLMLTLRALS
ncbi:sulfite exporter TauE/SafE family protein [Limnohabitans sp. 2KL-3]|uniref:sulfite exporter TauE/SafE family protein n=1 Tax=Limnohabitans sp. 2KL-3 TaxID=1100700 RepID=UPI000A7B43C6|nr:sulfite exporter TauE/SafE family protein [Limnohabitans sp. 2KL-3]